ncbi:DUF692 domain-containing protein [Paenibacillus methanolicus]|uniref:Uncharacterized protein n=1 Tax=Paenibacillus methanolicus TaxID=582686 RepID=A0A5S5CB08_9BACL|nr:DUF692 domain-containing protein [Paenibacillus methanolicus]TYP76507.1 hypothetical protein BCM02_103169 [Paenibacillus methanolicus]
MVKGVGVGFRLDFVGQEELVRQHVDFLEYSQKRALEAVKAELGPFIGQVPIVVHSLNLSLGSIEAPADYRVEALKQTADLVDAPWVSEHLSYSRSGDMEIDNFIALPYTDEAIDVVVGHIVALKQTLGRPILLENVTHSFVWPGSVYTEGEFIRRVLEKADCGLLLDVTNLFLNAETIGYDPLSFLNAIPRDRVLQLHVAGHTEQNGELYDSHVGGIDPKVLALTEWVMNNTSCDAITIERDTDMESFEDVLQDLNLCRAIYNKYRNASAPAV